MKFRHVERVHAMLRSHPSRGAWIEICAAAHGATWPASRTPHGVRGLKFVLVYTLMAEISRTPHGVRGLKFADVNVTLVDAKSHPSRGAWIEISPTGR